MIYSGVFFGTSLRKREIRQLSTMTVVFRVEASPIIGSGHLMRCLTLARQIRKRGAGVLFVMRDLPGHLATLVERAGLPVTLLPAPAAGREPIELLTTHSHWLGVHWETDARQTLDVVAQHGPVDWLVVDHYAIEKRWEQILRPVSGRILVIDDLADREHECDVLLDQNYLTGLATRYHNRVPAHCLTFLGPRYALLRDEFLQARKQSLHRTGRIEKILVFFGGYDPANATGLALRSIAALERPEITVEVVVGEANPHSGEISELCRSSPRFRFHRQIENIAELMNHSDLGLGAGGATMWERCYLGLPSLVLILAENQRNTTLSCAHYGAVENLGDFGCLTETHLTEKLRHCLDHPAKVRQMGGRALQLSDEGIGPPGRGIVESLWINGG
ncbi:MAG TPA: UDP-2,4-diacetamido-2,4,6-trideoxy-beta-L-altropyranose hydrolase [Atribacteraceae bacterium]|nr:UDP-2,4-diacetamido-2,4,6-trideoxy-beta-L-altropyranose hydrolase [Atribacteraceae bacterium]